MKHTLLVAVASAMIGAATAVFFIEKPAPVTRALGPSRSVDEAAIEAAFVRALRTIGFGEQARPPIAVPAPERPGDGRGDPAPRETAPPVRREEDPTLLPPAQLERLAGVGNFHEDEELRRRWIFRSEREVIDWLGTPSYVTVASGKERWIYQTPDGEGAATLEFHRGRLLNIWK